MVGFLAYDGDHITILPITKDASISGTLWVCRENLKFDTKIEFLEIGKMKKGTITPDFSRTDPQKFLYAPVFVFEFVK